MKKVSLREAKTTEKTSLYPIFEEAKPYFNKIEGRDPLHPLMPINELIPDIPAEHCHCFSIYYGETIIGYLWVLNDSPSSYYILHFYISQKYRNLGLGKLAIKELEGTYNLNQLEKAELVVSANNYLGLRFWKSVGFTNILNVYKEEDIGTTSVELELQKIYKP